MISRSEATRASVTPTTSTNGAAQSGRLVAVTGSGGCGASTMAMALAQGLTNGTRFDRPVLLADFALDADQALLHDVGDVIPGVQELVDAHRSGDASAATLRSLCFHIEDRGYDLLLGLRRHREWTTVRPRAFDAAMESLRRVFGVVIADVNPDVEGEGECGSIDVEERNHLARATTQRADVVAVVGLGDVKGLHRLVRVAWALLDHGVSPDRILPVINRSPRNPRRRSEVVQAFAALTGGHPAGELRRPIFVADRRRVDDLTRDCKRLPSQLVEPITAAVIDALAVLPARDGSPGGREPIAVRPGSIGSWSDPEPSA